MAYKVIVRLGTYSLIKTGFSNSVGGIGFKSMQESQKQPLLRMLRIPQEDEVSEL